MPLDFALFCRRVTGEVADVLMDKIENAQLAERLGYKYLFFIEHQNSAFPASCSAAKSCQTSRMRSSRWYKRPYGKPLDLWDKRRFGGERSRRSRSL